MHFILSNNTDSLITLTDAPDLEYKDGTEWEKIYLKKNITGIIGDAPLIAAGGKYVQKISLEIYDIPPYANILRIVQPYYISVFGDNETKNEVQYLRYEFTI